MAIKKVGVIGCGLMGHGIAQVAAQAGFDVTVRETESAAPFIRLLSRYRKEWLDVTELAKTRGYSWTSLVAPLDSLTEGARR